MRALALLTLAFVAGCSDNSGQNNETPAPVKLQSGQWQVASEVLSMSSEDKGVPAIKTAAGSKATTMECLTQAQIDRPQATMFGGGKGNCTYDRFYMADGELSAAMTCKQPGLQGTINSTIQGTYTATTFKATMSTATYLVGPGDIKMTMRVKGRRVGDCPAEAAPDAAPTKAG